jgi:Asp/Glu/hydantoin racemase
MPQKTLALVHTSATLVPVFEKLIRAKPIDVKLVHIADDTIIRDVIAKGKLTGETSRRVVEHLAQAERAGVDYVLVTCSSIGPAVDAAAQMIDVPVLRVDQPMADVAIRLGTKIGVVATLPTTLEPTADLVRRRAAAAGKPIELTAKLCEGAFEALMNGNPAEHDRAVAAAIASLAAEVDVIVLAQASMARVVEGLPESERNVPILASPPLAVDYLATVL